MEKKDKDGDTNESSLLLQMPRSIFSFGDMSGNSFLMPVAAVENNDGVLNIPERTENQSAVGKIEELSTGRLCQLEQPLMVRKSSSPQPPHLPPVSQEYNTTSEPFPGYMLNESQESCVATVPVLSTNAEYSQLPPPSSVPAYSETSSYMSHPPPYVSQPATTMGTTEMPEFNTNNYFSEPMPQYSTTNSNSTMLNPHDSHAFYEPAKTYWLFQNIVESKEIWCGFSDIDSNNLEEAFNNDPYAIVATDGGRYDVDLNRRVKRSVYFEARDLHVRRCTWFYRTESVQRFIPYEEDLAQMLEQHFYNCTVTGQWHKTLSLPGSGIVMMESPQVILHYSKGVDVWPSIPDSKVNAKVTKRGLPEEIELLPNESPVIDHLVFIVQGIGSFCDLRFRTVSQCVDGFRDIANRLMASHFRHEVEAGRIGRVEFLPLGWHAKLHTSNIGFDRRMQSLTLPSIPKLRHFTNDTLLDILLYSSPSYCQTILDTVASELNKLSSLFLSRNPDFGGKISVAGHSLGSLILFDILAHQPFSANEFETKIDEIALKNPNAESNFGRNDEVDLERSSSKQLSNDFPNIESVLEFLDLQEYADIFLKEKIDLSTLPLLNKTDLKELGIPKGPCKKLLTFLHSENNESNPTKDKEECPTSSVQNIELNPGDETVPSLSVFPDLPSKTSTSPIMYPKLHFEPACFFALGSPIAMFLAVRGYETISDDFRFPTCPSFFHIFHPYDPVAFRIEPLIDPNFAAKPALIPHHKGRKRMHIEIRENLSKVGSEIKQKVIETLRYTWNSLSGFAKAHSFPSAAVEAEVEKMVKQQMSSQSEDDGSCRFSTVSEISVEDIQIGNLNGGRRIDFVLQEKPIEALNDYIFALTSHATYWDSEDTVLMILKEVYAMQGITPLALPDSTFTSSAQISVAGTALNQNSGGFHFQEPIRNGPQTIESVSIANYNAYSDSPFMVSTSSALSGPDNNSHFTSLGLPPQQPLAQTQSFAPPHSQSFSTSPHHPFVPPLSQPLAPPPSQPLAPPPSQPLAPPPSQPLAPLPSQPLAPPPSQPLAPPPSQPLAPPPLSGFVRKSPFSK